MGHRRKLIIEIEHALNQTENRPGLCIYYANTVANLLHRHGLHVVIQAGSLQWPRIRRAEDDGVTNSHFAYMWSPHTTASLRSMSIGNLPEMHVWVGLIESQELVDFSTRHFKEAAQKLGMTWTADSPPPYVWCPANQLPDWVRYTPNREATLFACHILEKLFHPRYLRP